ncbi:hypothetical protein [Legionella drancourtii]|uniref:FAD-binding domain-containing protein n=1 Tax=Legionella drancourtii LLAP12 TaxID=658187 RepID=G9EQN9_9GAMM|nr:hypothetical protein [Legionella drancourtii]EHL30402.1 hypothetical protein LDG_7589 [Legionella drancourtii LLAP12]
MSREIVFVGAGPIGLWTAIQIKLKNPTIDIFFKEKKETYTRTHTLLLKPSSFAGCFKDETGVIQGIIAQLKTNPHIRTDLLEESFRALALQLGIKIDIQAVNDIEKDILNEYPDAALIIGSDGVRSNVRTQVFGKDNAVKEELAYAAQIKYFVHGNAVSANKILQDYPLLKHSKYLSSINVGKQHEGKTPVTIQLKIDKNTYEQLRTKTTYGKPIQLFADNIEELLPAKLLTDIKTQLGFRLSNHENIIVDDVKLTTTELPQQRCKQVTKFANGRHYAVIGDAALALSYFKGMNKGLQLATTFAKTVTNNWAKIIAKDESAFTHYEQKYQKFSTKSFKKGHVTNNLIKALQSIVNLSKYLPFQVIYFHDNEIADFHRYFDIIHQTSQFYMGAHLGKANTLPTAQSIKGWLAEQMPVGLPLLKTNLVREASKHQSNPTLYKALIELTDIDSLKLDFYEKAYLGLAFSKTRTLLENPTPENYQTYIRFANHIKAKNSSFALMLSGILQCIIGAAALTFGIIATIASGGMAAPLMGVGLLLTGYGFYKLVPQKNALSSIQSKVTTIVQENADHMPKPENTEGDQEHSILQETDNLEGISFSI